VPAPPPRNPGVRSERALLLADEVRDAPPPTWREPWTWARAACDRLSDAIDERLHERLALREAALASALVLGRADELDPAFKASLRAIGAWHFLAVSGSHVALVAALVALVLATLRLPERARLLATLFVVAAYALLSGAESPAVRAAIGCLGASVVVGRQRLPSAQSWLAAAFLSLMALDPAAALEAGLQLSFLAVVALAVASRYGPARSPKGTGTGIDFRAPLLRAGRCAIAAAVATSPLTAWHFGTVAWLAPAATLLLGPVVTVALTTALLAAIGTLLPAWGTAPLAPLLRASGWLLEQAAAFGDRLPATPMAVVSPSVTAVALLGSAWLALLARRPAVAAVLTIAGGLVDAGAPPLADSITLLDVGHGQAALVRAGGRCDLFDAGSDGTLSAEGLVRALQELAVPRIDALVLSHLDADHAGLAPALLEAFEVGECDLPAPARDELEASELPLLVALRDGARARGVPLRFLAAGDSIGPHAIVWPPRGRSFAARNDGSLVVRARAGATSVLLPADLEEYPLLELAAALEAPVDLLLLPHHGNADPGLTALIGKAQPVLLLASREERPFPRLTEECLRRCGLPWLTTGRGGALQLSFPRDGVLSMGTFARGARCR
jgi:competence protein ComEC